MLRSFSFLPILPPPPTTRKSIWQRIKDVWNEPVGPETPDQMMDRINNDTNRAAQSGI